MFLQTELSQWADLCDSLAVLGYNVTIAVERSSVVPTDAAVYYTDYTGMHNSQPRFH